MTLPQKLKEIKERAEKATPGPWYPCGCRYTMIYRDLNSQEIEDIAEVCNHFRDEEQIEMNKQFIAASRTDIPRLVKALEACRDQRNIMIGLHHGDYAEAINKITKLFDEKLEEILEGKNET